MRSQALLIGMRIAKKRLDERTTLWTGVSNGDGVALHFVSALFLCLSAALVGCTGDNGQSLKNHRHQNSESLPDLRPTRATLHWPRGSRELTDDELAAILAFLKYSNEVTFDTHVLDKVDIYISLGPDEWAVYHDSLYRRGTDYGHRRCIPGVRIVTRGYDADFSDVVRWHKEKEGVGE